MKNDFKPPQKRKLLEIVCHFYETILYMHIYKNYIQCCLPRLFFLCFSVVLSSFNFSQVQSFAEIISKLNKISPKAY